jgi:nitric oxide reductase NorE protein
VADAGRPATADTIARGRHFPGEAGVWVLILGDMVVFAMFFIVFVHYRGGDVPLYVRSRNTLNPWLGAANTLLMLTSSWFVALAVQAARKNAANESARLLGLAFLCGLSFVLVKVAEYTEKVRVGITLDTNDFYMYYFLFTGIHLVHVLIGMGVLVYLQRRVRAADYGAQTIGVMESGASFWHLVDILWIILFALLYLID